jgi:hypothetical protein
VTLVAAHEGPQKLRAKLHGKPIGRYAEIRRVPTGIIQVDHRYQRDLEAKRVERYAREWDDNKAGVLTLSERAGVLFCLEGQHRLAAAKAANVAQVNAYVIVGLSQTEEADLFVSLNQERKRLTSWALFKAETVAGRADALEIIRITNTSGFFIDQSPGDDHIVAVEALKRAYRLGGEQLLRRVLGAIHSGWLGEQRATSGQIVYGLALFFHACTKQPQYTEERFEQVIQKHSPARILREAQTIADRRSASFSSA